MARICELFIKRLCSGLWSGSFSVFRLFSDLLERQSYSVLFLYPFVFHLFFKACGSSRSFRMRTTNNSLSTMSSPVTASSPSSSGSTLAPTVRLVAQSWCPFGAVQINISISWSANDGLFPNLTFLCYNDCSSIKHHYIVI